jgi:hypothetical protein
MVQIPWESFICIYMCYTFLTIHITSEMEVILQFLSCDLQDYHYLLCKYILYTNVYLYGIAQSLILLSLLKNYGYVTLELHYIKGVINFVTLGPNNIVNCYSHALPSPVQ